MKDALLNRLEESKQLAHECLDRGDVPGAIAAMFAFAQCNGDLSHEDCIRLAKHVLENMGDDAKKMRRFIESWGIGNSLPASRIALSTTS
jgi:hypothetical protein